MKRMFVVPRAESGRSPKKPGQKIMQSKQSVIMNVKSVVVKPPNGLQSL